MKKIWGSLALCAMGLSVSSLAQADAYVAGGYGQFDQNYGYNSREKITTGDVVFKLGGKINDYFDAELRLGTTLATDTLSASAATVNGQRVTGSADAEYSEKYFGGGYLRVKWANSTMFTPYLIGGFSSGRNHVKVDVSGTDSNGNPVSASESLDDNWQSKSWGAGLDWDISDRLGVNLEYMVYRDDSYGVKKKGPSLSAYWRL
ncbi:MAG: outer membrane beta-barrel protein [Alcanivorax sp.]|nr:outer membrane beta-barrel protein [Alcanivorax sp.]